MNFDIYNDKAENILPLLPSNHFHSFICDPPAGISFMSNAMGWDDDKGGMIPWVMWLAGIFEQQIRTIRPGGYGLVWALPRTSHWTGLALEMAGYIPIECVYHAFSTGFPKSANISMQFDDMEYRRRIKEFEKQVAILYPNLWMQLPRKVSEWWADVHWSDTDLKSTDFLFTVYVDGVELIIGVYENGLMLKPAYLTRPTIIKSASEIRNPKSTNGGHGVKGGDRPYMKKAQKRGWHRMADPTPITDEARVWEGYGTRTKPAHEMWWLVQKPLSEPTIALNVRRWGTGGLNIRRSKIGTGLVGGWRGAEGFRNTHEASKVGGMKKGAARVVEGRWPPNLVLSHDEQCTDVCVSGCVVLQMKEERGKLECFPIFRHQAKPSRAEKDAGLMHQDDMIFRRVNRGGLENDPRWKDLKVKNGHPTLKSIELMRYFAKLITPMRGEIIDCFAGSGTTGCGAVLEGFDFVGIEMDPVHANNALMRIAHWHGTI